METQVPVASPEVTPTPMIESSPRDVRGAEVTGKAQDMPVGTDDGTTHTPEPTSALTEGSSAPSPS